MWIVWYYCRYLPLLPSANFVEQSKDNGDVFLFAQARRRCYSFSSCEHWGIIHSHLLTPRFSHHSFLSYFSGFFFFFSISLHFILHTHTQNKFFLCLSLMNEWSSGKANHIYSLFDEKYHPAIIIIININFFKTVISLCIRTHHHQENVHFFQYFFFLIFLHQFRIHHVWLFFCTFNSFDFFEKIKSSSL